MLLDREEMLDRAMASDGEYDRMFITGVLSTGIYCLPSCRARKPKPENIRFFETIEEAKAAGLRACKKCKPDDFLAGVVIPGPEKTVGGCARPQASPAGLRQYRGSWKCSQLWAIQAF